MTQYHPDLADEQAYIDHAYECLESSRAAAWKLRDLNEADLGGTFQARFERNAFDEALLKRLTDLDLGNAALVFGRIDRFRPIADDDVAAPHGPHGDPATPRSPADRTEPESGSGSESALEPFHIGRLAVSDADANPVVVDWRAPIAEPFYRATGRDTMGLARRRHFAVDGRTLLGIEDELFGEGHLGLGHDDGLAESTSSGLRGYSTLIASIERGRTGTLGDIVATIQSEQDEIIRSPQAGVLVVQGGPGTGKTVVALHRAAYLLYTHRFPLEDQGVLVIGPNRVFLKYIEQVLPSLGEAGIEQVTLAQLIPDIDIAPVGVVPESPLAARVKGDARMSDVIDQAITDRERPLRDDLVVPFRSGYLRLRAAETAAIVKRARRRFRRHNAARRWVEAEVWAAMAATWRAGDVTPAEVRSEVRRLPELREAFERMWPLLTPAELLHDLFGSMALLRLAADGTLEEHEYEALYRARAESVDDVRWSIADVALLDDAREVLGPQPAKNGRIDDADEIRTYGHIVIDEVQDLTPMQLKMATRRSLNGSLTVVGDIAQATGPFAPNDWDDVLAHLPDRKPPRVTGLSVGYRIPGQIMELAIKVMLAATPGLRTPESVRVGEETPRIVRVADLMAGVVDEVRLVRNEMLGGSVAVVAPDAICDEISEALAAAGLEHARAASTGLDVSLTVVPVSVVKGLELDGVVVVEPAQIVADQEHGLRALYVALTRSTQRLSVVHRDELPPSLR